MAFSLPRDAPQQQASDMILVPGEKSSSQATGVESMPPRRPRVAKPLTAETLPNDYKTIFAHNLRAARVRSGLTQAEIAKSAGVTPQYIQKIESGTENMTIDSMKRLAHIVDHNLLDMLSMEFSQPKGPPAESG